ncbi:MAG TPA: DUF4214 domain-containing protein [Oscillatoriaceae cyanobacterium M33_DOE_052]|uniref:DUF4214 domain-containing protein n=1 Tax=Planktothricoides sp. SpSt-374 TaxID=2282167 RepID=A0A7C3ZWS2_9CYAN|nr:DUF4214 domain-containing protein [Oscillatoriaceae cyanobacterium M33_DOE_052]
MKFAKWVAVLGLASTMAIGGGGYAKAAELGELYGQRLDVEVSCEGRDNWRSQYNIPDRYYAPSRTSNQGARFDLACRQHEQCYQKPGTGKSECDTAFLQAMRRLCDNAYSSNGRALGECYTDADKYYRAVARSPESTRQYQQAQSSWGRNDSRQNDDRRRNDLQEEVERLYREMLDITPSLRDINDYVDALERGWNMQRVREDIARSRDARYAIAEVYREVLERNPDSSGLDTYQRALARSWNIDDVREDIADSDEAERAINRIYREILGRNADRDGLRTYQRALARGRSLADVRRDIKNSSEARRRNR